MTTAAEDMLTTSMLISLSPGGKEYALSGDETTLGRSTSNTISLREDESVSRFHAAIRRKLGLFWLEDRESTNGTFLTPPDATELRLAPGEHVLLIDGASLRFGLTARFEVRGTAGSPDEAGSSLLTGLQEVVLESYTRLGALPPADGVEFLVSIRDYEARLYAAASESELGRLMAEGIRPLTKTVFGSLDREGLGVFGLELPPLAEDLPAPDAPRPPTVRGSIVRGMIDPDEPEGGNRP